MKSERWYDGKHNKPTNIKVGMYIEVVSKDQNHSFYNGIYQYNKNWNMYINPNILPDPRGMTNIRTNREEFAFSKWGGREFFKWRYVKKSEIAIEQLTTM